MAWGTDQGRGVYPEMQRFYRINMTALSWAEINRAAGNPFTFIIALPFVGFVKLFRIPLKLGDRMPREVSFQQVDQVTYSRCAPRVDPLLEATKGLGFEHFTTFRVPEMPFDSVVFTLMNRSENAYAAIYHVTSPAGSKTAMDFVTRFRDDSGLTTTNSKDGVAMNAPAHHHRQLIRNGPPQMLWAAHRQKVAELSPVAGGPQGPVSEAHFIETWRTGLRETTDFQAARGVFVPA